MYRRFRRMEAEPRPWKIHPVWRGIGCLLMILIPIISYAAATLLIDAYKETIPLPPELRASVDLVYFGEVDYFFARLGLVVLLIVIGFGLLSIVYSAIYGLFGPGRYGPLDARPEPRKPRRKTKTVK